MSTRETKQRAPDHRRLPAEPGAELVQQLLTERRDLMVANERLRLELEELRAGAGKPDPRLRRLEGENRRLRQELDRARSTAALQEPRVRELESEHRLLRRELDAAQDELARMRTALSRVVTAIRQEMKKAPS